MDSKQGLTKGPLKELYAELYKDLPYQLEHCIGSDPKSALFKAHDRLSGDPLEVRILEFTQPFIASRREPLARLLGALKEIRHQNLITLHDFILSEQRLVLATEPFASVPLQSYVEDPQNEPSLAFHALFQVLSGLEILHGIGIIHTDLSPNNIFLDSSGVVKLAIHPPVLADFGFDGNLPAGTPGYTAPELWNNELQHTQSSDVFSFGSLLYFCVTGGLHPARILAATKIPERYREIILCARAPAQDARYQSMRDLEYAILALGGYQQTKEEKSQTIFTLEDLENGRDAEFLQDPSRAESFDGSIFEMISKGLRPYWKVPMAGDRKSTRLNSSHSQQSRMPSSA